MQTEPFREFAPSLEATAKKYMLKANLCEMAEKECRCDTTPKELLCSSCWANGMLDRGWFKDE